MSFPLVPQPKPERAARKAAGRREERVKRLTRSQVRHLVFERAGGKCERCTRLVSFDVHPWKDNHAEVNEPQTRARGANPLDPKQCELLCHHCHFGGPSRSHAPTAARMRKRY